MKLTLLDRMINRVPLNSWFWITFIFFGQGLCSIAFSKRMDIPPEEIFPPILVLFLGGLCSLLFYKFSDSGTGSKWRGIVPALFYGLFIYLMSNRSFPGVTVGFDVGYFHPVEFATLGILLGSFWYSTIDEKGFGSFALRVIIVGAVFGLADEIHQSFVSGRDADAWDFVFDMVGILASILIIAGVRRVIRAHLTSSPKILE